MTHPMRFLPLLIALLAAGPAWADAFSSTAPATQPDGSTITINAGKLTANNTGCSTNCTFTTPAVSGGTIDGATIGGTTPGSGKFTTLSASSGLTVNGTASVGYGSIFNSTIGYTLPASGDFRTRYTRSTLTVTGTQGATNEENYFSAILTGGGTDTGEINIVHSNGQLDVATTNSNSIENFEGDFQNSGTENLHEIYLGLFANTTTGTVSTARGVYLHPSNANTTAGSFGEWDGFQCAALDGGGSPATFNYCYKNVDTNAYTNTVGPIVIGSLAQTGLANMLYIQSPGNSGSYYNIMARNSSGLIFTLQDTGVMTTAATNKIGAYNSANYIQINGVATGNAPSIKAAGSDTNVTLALQTNGTGALTMNAHQIFDSNGQFTAISSTAGSGTQTFTNSPCAGLTTARWFPVNITGQSGTWYVAACQ